jgi:hypothetical protein
MTAEEKQARLDRLNNAPAITRGQSSKDMIAAQHAIDRFCSTRFAAAVAAGRILRSQAEVLSFAKLPKELMGKADLAGVHDAATLTEFLKNASRSQAPE